MSEEMLERFVEKMNSQLVNYLPEYFDFVLIFFMF